VVGQKEEKADASHDASANPKNKVIPESVFAVRAGARRAARRDADPKNAKSAVLNPVTVGEESIVGNFVAM